HLLDCYRRRPDTFARSLGELEPRLKILAEELGPDKFAGQVAELLLGAAREVNRQPSTLADARPEVVLEPVARLLAVDPASLHDGARSVFEDFQSRLRAASHEDAPNSAKRMLMQMRDSLQQAKTRAKQDGHHADAQLLQECLVQVG